MSEKEELERELLHLEEELVSLEASRPAHSISVEMEMKMDALRERIERVKAELGNDPVP